jgi:endonuclease/exonuclease/phosphatase family metal-dependent hydrolase
MPSHYKLVIKQVLAFCLFTFTIQAQEQLRIATYNIKFLDTNVSSQGDRLSKLQQVISLLDAQVIGLQEIKDRAALELLFPPQDWSIVIDDDSNDTQDVALAVRKPFKVLNLPDDLDADDEHFLFPSSADNEFFPSRRDVLTVEVGLPTSNKSFFVMVFHSKSRVGGRTNTDGRREGSARKVLEVLKRDYEDKDFILLGDFNDNPDDASLNILETADPNAIGGPEEIDGPFLSNLTEELCVAGHVSHGRTQNDIIDGKINTIDPQSRNRNNNARGTNTNTGDILFDQILIPVSMKSKYVSGSITVFDDGIAIAGTSNTQASDHLPVSAEFIFEEEPSNPPVGIRIISLLPNPHGQDAGREEVTIGNFTTSQLNLQGWKLRDRAGKLFTLTGIVPANSKLTIIMTVNSMPLNNDGDEVELLDSQGVVKHKVTYSTSEVISGVPILFDN